jgi:hypothetical protein
MAQVQDSVVKTNLPGNTFYVYFINGYALAYKFYNSGNSDLRLRIDLSSSYSDTKGDLNNESNSVPAKHIGEITRKSSSNNITAEFAYSYNFYRSRLGQAYAGAGPFISYERRKNESSVNDNYPPQSGYTQTNSDLNAGFTAGLSAFIGLEAFLSQNLRVFAEMQLTGGREWSKLESHYDSIYQPNSSRTTSFHTETDYSWFYNVTSVRVGLGISI